MSEHRFPTPNTGSNGVDYAVSVVKGVIAAIPVAGGLLAELISISIPNQRMDRLESYLKSLTIALEEILPLDWAPSPSATALLEESVYEAARPVSDDRRAQIAKLVASGMTASETEANHHRFLLSVLKELSDYDLALLDTYMRPTDLAGAWRVRGIEGVTGNEQVRIRQLAAVADLKLERLGLTTFNQRMDRRSNEPRPAYSSFGKSEGNHSITSFGRDVLAAISGLPTAQATEPTALDP